MLGHSTYLICQCAAAFSGANALELHVKGEDFGNLGFQVDVNNDACAGYGIYNGYRNDLFKNGGTANLHIGYADPLNAPFRNNTGAVPYSDYDWNTTYTPVSVVNDIIGSGSGTGYGVSTGYHNDMLTADIATNDYTEYTDSCDASLGNNVSIIPYVDYGWNSAYTAVSTVNSAVASGSGTGYRVSTGYHNDMFTADIPANGYTGYTDPRSASLEKDASATPCVDYGWNPAYTAGLTVNSAVGSDSGTGYGVSTDYHNDMFAADIPANDYTEYTDPRGPSLEKDASAALYVDYGWNPAYTVDSTVNSAVRSDSGTGYRVFTGYNNDMFTADIAANGYTGYADPDDAFLGNNAGAIPYTDYGWNPTSFATSTLNNIIGSGFGSGSSTGSGMPPRQPNMGAYHPLRPPAPIDPARVPCTHPNCGRTFSRSSDMARHAKKHETNPVRYPCPVPGCTFIGAKAFLRHDKLLSHGRNAHGMEI